MKKGNVLVLGALIAMGLSSCIKDGESFDWRAQYEIEKPIIEEYAQAHMIAPQLHEATGIWYEIVSPGDPTSYEYKASPAGSGYNFEIPDITVTYTGKLLNSTTPVLSVDDEEFSFNQAPVQAFISVFFPEVIEYDLDGEPLDEPYEFGGITETGLKKGAIVRFVTPSYLAYANSASSTIPANSPLYFEVELHDIVPPSETGN